MRIRISLASFMALVIAHVLAPQTAYADSVVYYTVYYSCHVGPGGCNANGDWYGCLVGEWTLNCTGQWTGWGMEPYTSCAEFVDERFGRSCGPDVQGLSSRLPEADPPSSMASIGSLSSTPKSAAARAIFVSSPSRQLVSRLPATTTAGKCWQ